MRVLQRREAGKDYLENLLECALEEDPLSPANRALVQEIVYGVVRHQSALDWLIARKTGGREQKPILQILLRLSLYQLFWLDRIPNYAAVNESVELAKQLGYVAQSGFLNALLRGYLREQEETERLLRDLKWNDPATGYSQPQWLLDRWDQRWGREQTVRLLEWNNTPPPTYARLNTLQTDASKLLTHWRQEGVEYDFFLRDWTGENLVFKLKAHPPLAKLGSFQQGEFYIQDPSTLLAVHTLNPQPGQNILDLCAAPGGKTTYLAQLMKNQGRVIARDSQIDRLKLVVENCQRLKATCVEIPEITPLSTPLPRRFEGILVDAPCSNTGVLRRRVDLRWRIRPEEIERLATTQLDLLRQAAQLLKDGGAIVYSTCSLEMEENQGMVKKFLATHPGFRLESERELLPFKDGVDGAYAAKLVRA